MAHLSDALHRPGALIRYSDSGGDGPAVVFTHGAGMDHTVFAPQLQAVRATGRRAIAHDLRGHGASALDDGIRFTAADALEDLAALLDALDLQHPVLVGHSLGGNLSQALVRRRPDRAGGLVVISATEAMFRRMPKRTFLDVWRARSRSSTPTRPIAHRYPSASSAAPTTVPATSPRRCRGGPRPKA